IEGPGVRLRVSAVAMNSMIVCTLGTTSPPRSPPSSPHPGVSHGQPMITPALGRAARGSTPHTQSQAYRVAMNCRPFCPISGKNVVFVAEILKGCLMAEPTELSDLVTYLARTTRLTTSEALHVVNVVLAFLNDLPEEFVCRRHRALQAEG